MVARIAGMLVASGWAIAALYFDSGAGVYAAIPACLATVALIVLAAKRRPHAFVTFLILFVLVLLWWFRLQPSATRDWKPDVERIAKADIQGDVVTISNVRNFDYRTETEYTPRWETRTLKLSELTGADLFLINWGIPEISHLILSFEFTPPGQPPVYLPFSVETRQEKHESYSAVRGFFRQYELIYIAADERDVVRLRTNYRQGENAFLYRLKTTPESRRRAFLAIVNRLNRLHDKPEWYNALTANCTTSITSDIASNGGSRLRDIRLLLNGYLDQAAYERGLLEQTGPFEEIRRRALINDRAKAAGEAPDFSRRIRAGL
jgi:hypothetical protein